MDAPATTVTSHNSRNSGTPSYVTASRSRARLLHPWREERTNTGRHLVCGRTD
jgi:hypothetical protein